MARGMVVGEQIVSQAQTKDFDDGYERTFGARKPQRGRWVMTPEGLVSAEDYVPEARAVDAPIMVGRCHEGQVAPDGTDISTRAKRAAWMRETGHADHDDFKGAREKRARELAEKRQMVESGKVPRHDPKLRDQIGRELYKRKMIL